MRSHPIRLACLLFLPPLAGCGGGGGGDGAPVDLGAGFSKAIALNQNPFVVAPANDGSGDVYAGGAFDEYQGATVNGIVRINAGGARDPGFEVGTGFDSNVRTIAAAVDGSGDIYVGGDFTAYRGTTVNHVVRINADGSRDADFDVGSGFDADVYAIATAADGSGDIYVGGAFTTYRGTTVNRVVRINADGSRDAGFDVGTGFDFHVRTIAAATDGTGDIYAGGSFTMYRAATVICIVRIDADGARDAGFDVGAGFDGIVFSLATAADGSGDVYAGGDFTAYRGASGIRLVRINADGARDAAFVVGAGFDGSVLTIAAASDGSGDLFSGGSFASYNSTLVECIARLDPDGTLD